MNAFEAFVVGSIPDRRQIARIAHWQSISFVMKRSVVRYRVQATLFFILVTEVNSLLLFLLPAPITSIVSWAGEATPLTVFTQFVMKCSVLKSGKPEYDHGLGLYCY